MIDPNGAVSRGVIGEIGLIDPAHTSLWSAIRDLWLARDSQAGGSDTTRILRAVLQAAGEMTMAQMPQEPSQFAEQVAEMLRKMQPESAIELTGPRELIVNGRRLDLENLLRLVRHDPSRGSEIVEHYLDQLFCTEASMVQAMGFDTVQSRIMPRVQPESIFNHLARDQVAHVPFVNGTVIVFVIDMPQMTISVTTEQMVRWGVDADRLEELARENLAQASSELELQVVTSKEGGQAIVIAQQDGYDAARLLLDNLYRRLAPRLGGDFYVATPSRDMFVAVSAGPEGFVKRIQQRVREDFARLPYPISPEFFLVTRDGVAGTIEPMDEFRADAA